MLKAIEIRLYPSEEQVVVMNKLLGCCRLVYNKCLEHRISQYKDSGESGSLSKSYGYYREMKEMDEFCFLKTDSRSKVIQQALRNQESAFKNFFSGLKSGKPVGFPKFKSKKDAQSCRFPKDAISKVRGNRIDIIKSLNDIHFKCSRKDETYLNRHQEKIVSATLRKTPSNKYILSVLIDRPHEGKFKQSNSLICIDLGVKDFVITSNGDKFENKHFYKKQEKKLKRLQRRFAKSKVGGTGHEKLRVRIAKVNEKIKNQRNHYIHSIVNQLLNDNQIIVVEDLNIKGMMKNRHLSKAIQDVSMSEFVWILIYKSQWNDKRVVKINRFFPSSKRCSSCGYKNNLLKLSDREWVCPECGEIHDRDVNAAKNILEEGKRIIGLSSPEFKQVEMPTMDDRRIDLKSSASMKLEKNVI